MLGILKIIGRSQNQSVREIEVDEDKQRRVENAVGLIECVGDLGWRVWD